MVLFPDSNPNLFSKLSFESGGGLTFSPRKFSRLVEGRFGGRPHYDVGAAKVVGVVGRRIVEGASGVDGGSSGGEFAGDGGTEVDCIGLDF